MKTTGVSVVETAFQTSPFPILSSLLKALLQRVDSISYEGNRALRTGWWIVTRHSAIECYLDRFQVVALYAAECRQRTSDFTIVIDILSLHHLREIDGHSIKELSRL